MLKKYVDPPDWRCRNDLSYIAFMPISPGASHAISRPTSNKSTFCKKCSRLLYSDPATISQQRWPTMCSGSVWNFAIVYAEHAWHIPHTADGIRALAVIRIKGEFLSFVCSAWNTNGWHTFDMSIPCRQNAFGMLSLPTGIHSHNTQTKTSAFQTQL